MSLKDKQPEAEENIFLQIIEKTLRGDPLLLPYFEDGSFRIVDEPENDYLWFKPDISPETREFILERVQVALGDKPEEDDVSARREWERREEVKKRLESDDELARFVLAEALIIRNTAHSFRIKLDPSVTDDIAEKIIGRMRTILKEDFDIGSDKDDNDGSGQ